MTGGDECRACHYCAEWFDVIYSLATYDAIRHVCRQADSFALHNLTYDWTIEQMPLQPTRTVAEKTKQGIYEKHIIFSK